MISSVASAFQRSVAVVLGVDRYPPGLPSLTTARTDATALAACLASDHGFDVVTLLDADVTRKAVEATLVGLPATLAENDRVVFYFAGHGLSLPSDRGPEGYLILADADARDAETFFPMRDLRDHLDALPCRHMLVILDCCFAGTFRWSARRDVVVPGVATYRETFERYVRRRAWQVLVSASHDEQARDSLDVHTTRIERGLHSPFAEALLAGLAGAADYTRDHLIVAAELELFIRDRVERATGFEQTPQLYKLERHDRGEFVFQVPGTVLVLEPAPALAPSNCPYRGLEPYAASDSALFFGRRKVVRALTERVKTQPFTAIVGRSGSGKTSLLGAGVLPALRTPDFEVVWGRPGPTPRATLAAEIAEGTSLIERIRTWMERGGERRLVVVVDQCEELVTLAPRDERDAVLTELAQAIERFGPRLRVVLSMRTEFDPLLRASRLEPLWRGNVFAVPPLTQDELREVIEQPARAHELSFEPAAIVDDLINETIAMPGGLPLLSFTLRELYLACVRRDDDRLLTREDYDRIGGFSGAIASRASATLADLVARDPAIEATVRRVFLRMLVRHGDDWLRRRVPIAELHHGEPHEDERVVAVLRTFEAARLLVSDGDDWEPAHDELVRSWPALVTWRAEFTQFALQRELSQAATAWERHDRRPGYLWKDDARLPEAARVLRSGGDWLNQAERAFVARSLAARRRSMVRRYALLGLALLAAATGLWIWDGWYRSNTQYFLSNVRRWGAPTGIHPLSASEARARGDAVRITRRGRYGRVERLELVSNGEPCRQRTIDAVPELQVLPISNGARTPCVWGFGYEGDTERLVRETATDVDGRVVYSLSFRPSVGDQIRLAEYTDEDGRDSRGPTGSAELIEFRRDAAGLDIESRYLLRDGRTLGTNEDGYAILGASYDARGNQISGVYLDDHGAPMRNVDGHAGFRRVYDANDNEVEVICVDEAGRPTLHAQGFASYRSTFDVHGNELERAYFDERGAPTRRKDGFSVVRHRYDDRGYDVVGSYFDESGAPIRSTEGFATYRRTYDERGQEIEVTYLDEHGQPTRARHGYAGYRRRFDDHGREREVDYIDERGRPTANDQGYASYRRQFDARGRELEIAYFDEQGRPTTNKNGSAVTRRGYDERGYEVDTSYLDPAGHPAIIKYGFARLHRTFNARGQATEQQYIGLDDKPVRLAEGYSRVTTTYDTRGNELAVAYFDDKGQRARIDAGYAGYRSTYDARGNRTSRTYVDELDEPMLLSDGYAGYQSTFDHLGRETDRWYVGVTGAHVRIPEGYVGYHSSFDARGREIARAYLDDNGLPTNHRDGNAIFHRVFDARGNEVERSFYDSDLRRVNITAGYAMARSRFDARGNEIEVAFFDVHEQPVRLPGGYAIYRNDYDASNRRVRLRYFDEHDRPIRDGNGVAGYRSGYDAWGNETERTYFDEAGQPTPHKRGITIVRSQYDARGNEIEVAYFGPTGAPVAYAGGGPVRVRMEYDAVGRPTRSTGFDLHGVALGEPARFLTLTPPP